MQVKEIEDIIAPTVALMGFELLGCQWCPGSGRGLLRIYIDSEQGVTIDDCADVSRQISALLDVEDPIPGTYNLEVSSPGVKKPLFKGEHYKRVIGQKIHIHLHMALNGQRNFTGELQTVEDEKIVIIVDGQEKEFLLSNIQKANCVANW